MRNIKLGIQIIPQRGDMSVMRQRWLEAEALGADVLYTCDHFNAMQVESTEVASRTKDSQAVSDKNFEGTTIQAAMAATTTRAEIGCIVHANCYHNPNLIKAGSKRSMSNRSDTATRLSTNQYCHSKQKHFQFSERVI